MTLPENHRLYNFGQSFVRDLGLVVSVLAVIGLIVWRSENFKDYGGILGAVIGTLGAALVAFKSIDKTNAHNKAEKLADAATERASIAVIIMYDLALWIQDFATALDNNSSISDEHTAFHRNRFDLILKTPARFTPDTIRATLQVVANLEKMFEFRDGRAIFVSGEGQSRNARTYCEAFICNGAALFEHLSKLTDPDAPFVLKNPWKDRTSEKLWKLSQEIAEFHRDALRQAVNPSFRVTATTSDQLNESKPRSESDTRDVAFDKLQAKLKEFDDEHT